MSWVRPRCIDTPARAERCRSQVGGWALDRNAPAGTGTGVDAVHVHAYPNGGSGTPIFLGAAVYGNGRSDVAAIYGSQFMNSGYNLACTTPLTPGTYLIAVFPHNTVTGVFGAAQTKLVTIQ